MSKPVGIDLGTSTSEIAFFDIERKEVKVLEDKNGNKIIDSALAVYRGELYIGNEAKNIIKLNPENGLLEFKRNMGDDVTYNLGEGIQLSPISASVLMLKYLKHIAELNGIHFDNAVISVPANFPQGARYATLVAAELAGIRVLRLINEPTAAVLSLAFDNKFREKISDFKPILVFDFGGGTLDITVLEATKIEDGMIYQVLASYGDMQLGGKDIDELLAEQILREIPNHYHSQSLKRELKELSEEIKIKTSSFGSFNLRKPITLDYVYTKTFDVNYVDNIFKKSNFPKRIISTLSEAIKRAKVDKNDILVIMAGGTSKFKPVINLIKEYFDKSTEILIPQDPQLAIVKGSSIACAIEKKIISSEIVMVDVSPFGIGIETLIDFQEGKLAYSPLIQPNTSIPYTVKREYSLIHPEQRVLDVKIYQTHDYAEEGTPLNQLHLTPLRIKIDNIPPATGDKPWPVVVKFTYNTSGLIELNTQILDYNGKIIKEFEKTFTPSHLVFSKDSRTNFQNQINNLWVKLRKD